MDTRISVVALGVRDLERSKSFYTRMGWALSIRSSKAIAFFQGVGMVLSLYPWDLLADDATVSSEGNGFRGVTLAQNTRSKDEVDQVLKEAQLAGARIVKPAQEVFWGGYSGYFADPDGHLWEIVYNPNWSIEEDGSLILPETPEG